jgi:hypothetical protein
MRFIRMHPFASIGVLVTLATIMYAGTLALSPQWRTDFYMSYFGDARFVDLPLAFDFALLMSALLNIPALLIAAPIAAWIRNMDGVSREVRLLLGFCVYTAATAAWWYVVWRVETRLRSQRTA